MDDFVTTLRSGRPLVMDGAMGTEIIRRGGAAVLRGCNLSDPQLVQAIHRDYLDAGADVLLTNTFQANPIALESHELSREVWQAAIRLARVDHERPRRVLADIGPMENATPKLASDMLAECVDVDGILLETWSSFDALRCFADRPDVPLLVSFTYHRTSDLTTIHGARPEDCARAARQYGAVAVGANCGKEIGMDDLLEIVKRYRTVCDLPIFVRPNAGTPSKTGWRYPRSPDTMAAALPALLDAGIAMIGGCCGTTPEHIARFRAVVDEWNAARAVARR